MKTYKVLHICSYFNTSSLYNYLITSLEKHIDKQFVYIPMYKKQELIKEYGTVRSFSESSDQIQYDYNRHLLKWMRYTLLFRIFFSYKKLDKEFDPDIIHAHSLVFNGGIAYLYNRHYKVPYIVAVRSTDLAVLNKLPFYKPLIKKILNASSGIVFISNSLKNSFVKDYRFWDTNLEEKAQVIPNGVPDNWYNLSNRHKPFSPNGILFLYQGTLHNRKNIPYTIKLLEKLNEDGYNCYLKIVGEGPEKEEITNIINDSPFKTKISLEGWSNDIDTIRDNYLSSDFFIMLSSKETFGISYIESLACNTPIIYRSNEGIDGMVTERQGVRLDCDNLSTDASVLEKMFGHYNRFYCYDITFSWDNIANDYYHLYASVRGNT